MGRVNGSIIFVLGSTAFSSVGAGGSVEGSVVSGAASVGVSVADSFDSVVVSADSAVFTSPASAVVVSSAASGVVTASVVVASVACSVGLSVVCSTGSVTGGKVLIIILGFLPRRLPPGQAERKEKCQDFVALHSVWEKYA